MAIFMSRRLGQAVLVMLSVAFIAFLMFHFLGDPVTSILPPDATQEQRQELVDLILLGGWRVSGSRSTPA